MTSVIFDLDGTLIDSAPGILTGFELAFKSLSLTPVRALSPDIIGPPVRETLATLLGHSDPLIIDHLVEAFKASYDEEGYKNSPIYPGINTLLQDLRDRGIALFLATNKRHTPTQKIIDHLGWRHHFIECLSFDSLDPPRSKAAVIAHLIEKHQLEKSTSAYVGDRIEDGLAAEANGIAFRFAAWGYGAPPKDEGAAHWRRLDTPNINDVLSI